MQEAKKLDCGVALRRLVARHPSVGGDPQVARLLREGYQEDYEVLAGVQNLLLRPHLTVAVAGCFRPLLLRLIDGLLQSLRQLWLERSVNSEVESVHRDSTSPLLDSYGKSIIWSASIHEYAVLAFSRILELAPYCLSSVLQYFSFAPIPFERLLHANASFPEDAPHLLDVVRASYRYLRLDPKSFRELWDWSPFLDLLQWTDTKNLGSSQSDVEHDVRWCATQVLSLVFRMSDFTTRALSYRVSQLTKEDSFASLKRWEKFSDEVAVEKAGMYFECNLVGKDELMYNSEKTDSSIPAFEESHSIIGWRAREGAPFMEIFGVQLPVRQEPSKGSIMGSFGRSFVLTSTVTKNLESVVLALSQRQPIMLEGPIGAGKSVLIQELANLTGNSDVIFIHLDDQMDSKTLLGSYVCTEIPGEFKWQPGALTQAVVQGIWVVFEDIDRAPFEILSALVPLLEDRKLYIAGRGEMLQASENFYLFSTVTRTKFGSSHRGPGGMDVLTNLWRRVVIDAPSDEELVAIIEARFPMLSALASKLIETLNLLRDIASQSAVQSDGLRAVSAHIGRQFSTRDLIKWCNRLSILESQHFDGWFLSTYARERIFVEAVDCFAGSIPSMADRQVVIRAIADRWEIPLNRVDYFSRIHKPLFQVSNDRIQIGRANLFTSGHQDKVQATRVFAKTGHAMRLLESIALCVERKEPVLLVGETGTGKTSLVQYLAKQMGMPLTVLNLSQQSDSVDLLGGYKPVEAQSVCIPLFDTYCSIFRETFPMKKNAELLEHVSRLAAKKRWDKLLKAFRSTVRKVVELSGSSRPSQGNDTEAISNGRISEDGQDKIVEEHASKRKRLLNNRILERWRKFSAELSKAERQVESAKTAFAFQFVEGALVKALKEGHWILLDEVNLAPTETIERLTGVLEPEKGSLSLTERGDVESIKWHPDFRIFACMNPATDVGKRDLPISLKNRLTEFYVDELTNKEDLHVLVHQYLEAALPSPPVEDIVNYYLLARQEADVRLLDGANQKPQYSLRSLARALEYTKAAMPVYGFQRSLYDGVCMSFLTLLDRPSSLLMEQLILRVLFKQIGTAATNYLKSLLKVPLQPTPRHTLFAQFWVESGDYQETAADHEACRQYVLTNSIQEHLKNLARAVFVRRYPVLLQGPTSSGKTSMVEYLALTTGHRFVRINNHEHTDLQEYLGSYVTDANGKLVFQEGILVQAVRNGYWIVLDELNLAPSDVLEALNRLLDDNRELFVPELQVMVKPHPHFMLFATQNPPGVYGGRKVLSRAFRNRFIELHVDDIPDDELQVILEKRCQIPGSYASKMVEVMKDLQRHRQGSKVFAGKNGFITPRDLFRWAERHANGYEDLAWDGYMLLAERLRNKDEMLVVQNALEKHMRVRIQPDQLHELSSAEKVDKLKERLKSTGNVLSFGKIVWTKSMRRLFNLVERCVQHSEPVLLVGDTGCGKTTVCQLLAVLLQQKLHILNCHQHSETADFIGGLRPVRDRDNIAAKYSAAIQKLLNSRLFTEVYDGELSYAIEDASTTMDTVHRALSLMKSGHKRQTSSSNMKTRVFPTDELEVADFENIENELLGLQREHQSLFLWHDGPLVEAMRDGDIFLIDEISLADDSVLERLNSVLEPKRLLVLAERGGSVVEELVANPSFRILATMNPGGDFGKKELSPALRNRFTEIWVPPIIDLVDLESIVLDRFSKPELFHLKDPILTFWQWFQHHGDRGRLLSVRDLLSWVNFINITSEDIGHANALVHGALLVLLDGIGLGTGLSSAAAQHLRSKCLEHLSQLLPEGDRSVIDTISSAGVQGILSKMNSGQSLLSNAQKKFDFSSVGTDMFGIHPFYVHKGKNKVQDMNFELAAPTTSWNALRILRAMQLPKPVLLEGSPGVGKTSLVAALALSACHPLVRINLSEQTDVMDLFGSDMPVEGGKSGEFCWSDGVFLQALKAGHWVLLDELNLASQSVLEGLNACLDHRGEVFIPELGRVFKCPTTFRVFACQNPISEGGGRKGLPKSFLNRFTKVYVDALLEDDFLFIAQALHPTISESLLRKMVQFNARLYEDIMVSHTFGQSGSPWEFNLRDILRCCELMEGVEGSSSQTTLNESFLDVVYLQRMRTKEDRQHVLGLYNQIFGVTANIKTHPLVLVSPEILQVGRGRLQRNRGIQVQRDTFNQLQLLPGLGNSLESLVHCVKKGWMCNIVGPAASGKTSLIRMLAALTGNTLHEFALSSATDTTELLGCFEQYDSFRFWQDIVKRAHASLEAIGSYCLSVSMADALLDRRLELMKSLMSSWTAFQKCLRSRSLISIAMNITKVQESLDPVAIEMLLQTLKHLEKTRIFCEMPELDPSLRPEDLLKSLNSLKETYGQAQNLGRFEWIDGGLLKALERGDWVLLENANFCNPTVLDRLNPLLEPDGTILINERGLVHGEAMVIRAHPNFRLFLTVDPSYGQVSRAMRNRGIEIFLMQPDWCNVEVGQRVPIDVNHDNISKDGYKLILHAGIPSPSLARAMYEAHTDVKSLTESLPGGMHISLRELSRWVSLLQQLLERGAKISWSLTCSWVQTYVRHLDTGEAREAALHIFKLHFTDLDFLNSKLWQGTPLFLPGGWPRPHNLELYCMKSEEACIERDAMYLELLLAQVCADKTWQEWQGLLQTAVDRGKQLFWLFSERGTLSYFPASLLESFLNPDLEVPVCSSITPEKSARLVDNLTKLEFASLWMVERGSVSDMKLRILCLENFARNSNGCQTLSNLVMVLRREFEHILAKELFSAIEQLDSEKGGNGVAKHVPCNSHDSVLSMTANLTLEASEGFKNACTLIIFLGKKVLALRHCLVQWQKEDQLYKSVEIQDMGTLASPVLQSYVHHTNKILRKTSFSPGIPRTVLKYLYPFLTSMRNLENEILLAVNINLWETSVERVFTRLRELHKSFYTMLKKGPFNIERFLFYWVQTKRILLETIQLIANSSPTCMKISGSLQDIIQIWDETFHLGAGSGLKPLLWKFGGHPQLFTSNNLWELERKVLSCCNARWGTSFQDGDKQFRSLDLQLRRDVLEGLSMSVWLRQRNLSDFTAAGYPSDASSISAQETQQQCYEILEMVLHKLDMLKPNVEEVIKENFIPLARNTSESESKKFKLAGCECKENHQDEQLELADLMHLPGIHMFWIDMLQWLDCYSISLDSVLLAKISMATVLQCADYDLSEVLTQQGLDAKFLRSSLEFSLTTSSRSPLDFVPHQHVLWITEAMTSRTVNGTLEDINQDMWFRWHQANWRTRSQQLEELSQSWTMTEGPARLFQAVQSVILSNKLGRQGLVKDYWAELAQIRITCLHMWTLQKQELPDVYFLGFISLSALFQQVLAAHKKSFMKEEFSKIRQLLCTLHEGVAKIESDDDDLQRRRTDLKELEILLGHSKHSGLQSILHTLVLPCAAFLYCSSRGFLDMNDSLVQQGRVWLYIGLMRLHLLLPASGCDPVAKYMYRQEHLSSLLADLELEIEVRQRSELMARGSGNTPETDLMQSRARELKEELSTLSFKITYRPVPPRFRDLCQNVQRFMELSASPERMTLLWTNLTRDEQSSNSTMETIVQEALAWQDNSGNFMDHLCQDFPAYMDFVQPIQLAVFELKFGISLSMASHLQRKTLAWSGIKLDGKLADFICLLMEFPSCPHKKKEKFASAEALLSNDNGQIVSWAASLQKSSTISEKAQQMELQLRVLQIALLKAGHEISQSCSTTKADLKLLDFIFSSFSSLWIEIREYRMEQKSQEAEQLRFSTSAYSMEIDETMMEEEFKMMFPNYKSDFGDLDENMHSAEDDDRRAEEALAEPVNENIVLAEKAWERMEESLLKDITHIHECIFSSSNILQSDHQTFKHVSEADRLHSFNLAYDTGRQLLQAVGHCLPARVDENLLSAHLMRANWEFRKLAGVSQSAFIPKPDMYSDAQPSEIALMLEPLGAFLKRIMEILMDWPEHPILQQLLKISQTLLSFSLDVVVMKALTGIELLLSKAQIWEENAAKHVSIAGELSSLSRLVTRWRKLELEGWSSLLEKTERKHEFSARKLWYSLYGLLHRDVDDNVERYMDCTISSIEEFMHTATIGEYRTRLKLIQAFHGHFAVRNRLKALSNGLTRESIELLSNVLYNVFKYYSQFLPMLDEMVGAEKSTIEKELKEFVRLAKWDDRSHYTLTLSAEKSHRKLQKLVKKYNEVLKRSVSELLSKQALQMGTKNLSLMDSAMKEGSLPNSVGSADQTEAPKPEKDHQNDQRAISKQDAMGLHSSEWRKRFDTKLVQLKILTKAVSEAYPTAGVYQSRLPALSSKIADLLAASVFSQGCSIIRVKGADSLEMISTSVIVRASELRIGAHKLAVKKKAIFDLLKALKQIGLSRRKSAVRMGQRTPQSWLQIQPAEAANPFYNQHTNLAEQLSGDIQGDTDTEVVTTNMLLWKKASDYYFKNMSLLQHLQCSALDYHKDLSLREVELTTRYAEHLLYLQQCQRSRAHGFSSKLSLLGRAIRLLSECGKSGTSLPRQGLMKKWLWLQKDFFDSLHQVVSETLLLFKLSEGVQSCPANSMRIEASSVRCVLQELSIGVQHCKMLLDSHLLLYIDEVAVENGKVSWPLLYTPAMLKDLKTNFDFLSGTQITFRKLFEQDRTSSMKIFSGLKPLQLMLSKGYEIINEFDKENAQAPLPKEVDLSELSSHFTHLYDNVISETLLAVQKVSKTKERSTDLQSSLPDADTEESVELEGTIQTFDEAIMSQMVSLRVDTIFNALFKVLAFIEELLECDEKEGNMATIVGKLLSCLHVPLEILHAAGVRLLSDYINLHKSVTKLGYILSNLFVSLCTDGFCVTKEEDTKEGANKFDDASGTGMGEGEGKKDVSEQIEDEEQLMGGTEKEDVPQTEAGNHADKGIEMEQDFSGEMLDLSDDEQEEDDESGDEEEENLESKMGEEESQQDVVDEKLWNNEDKNDGKPDAKEKYEKDSALSGSKPEDIEMRGKEDESLNEGGKADEDEDRPDSKDNADNKQGIPEVSENDIENGNEINEDENFEEKTGVKPSIEETLDLPENLNLDSEEDGDKGEDQQDQIGDATDEQGLKEDIDDMKSPETKSVDENIDEGLDDQVGDLETNPEDTGADRGIEDEEANLDMDVDDAPLPDGTDGKKDDTGESNEDMCSSIQDEDVDEPQEQGEQPTDPQNKDARTPGDTSEHADVISGVTGLTSHANDTKGDERRMTEAPSDERHIEGIEMSSLEAINGANRTPSVSDPSSSNRNTSHNQRHDINPYRSLGDALRHWKERIRVVDAIDAPQKAESSETVGEKPAAEGEDDGMEYEYVAEEEQGDAQALGSATKEQLDESNKLGDSMMEQDTPENMIEPDMNTLDHPKDVVPDIMKETEVYAKSKKNRLGNVKQDTGVQSDASKEVDLNKDIRSLHLEDSVEQITAGDNSIVSIGNLLDRATALSDSKVIDPVSEVWTEEEISRARKEVERGLQESAGNIESARILWQKYEHLTARLSQELAEQLRLILEPTLATKLEGDYRTGKRINMKKIIPYIASSFRKDKIWLRRTKASKRQYQVVIAIDDSRSMSESHCGHMAVEALITICRAMSHVEIGQMAVASFGQRGNVQVLHDFDQPFSSEAGVNMVSRFSFTQDNTIADQPMVDLLQFLTGMLDMAASDVNGPSVNVNLQQLVLIIADGRFHEKESMRRCVREATSRKQLLAFIVLDNPQESIIDMQSVSFANGVPCFSKYLDSFPFPYYILLREIESLPRTLADLMRQWFELTQRSMSGQ